LGLEKCLKEMKEYQTCMEAFERKKPPRLLRVRVMNVVWTFRSIYDPTASAPMQITSN